MCVYAYKYIYICIYMYIYIYIYISSDLLITINYYLVKHRYIKISKYFIFAYFLTQDSQHLHVHFGSP